MPDTPPTLERDQTDVGSYFVANYPPFSVWTADAVERVHQRGAILHQLLGLLGIVPEIGIFRERVQLGQACRRFLDVKDASSAARPTA